jgi:uroporphyrinogen-III synthase
MRGRVLVTRPEPGASRTARRLAEAGFEPVVLPLTEIRQLPARPVPEPSAVDAVAVTSANAIRHAPPQLIASLAGIPLFAVGNRTARIARESGFSRVFEGEGDAAGLASLVVARLSADARVLYLCGRVRRPEFEAALAAAGLVVDAMETYDTVEISRPADLVLSALQGESVTAALVLSARTAEAISSLVEPIALSHLFEHTRYFCISSRVAAALAGIGPNRIAIAETPDEDALIALLGRES